MSISQELRDNYANYYRGAGEAAWRELSALDKADNIMRLCVNVPHASILEIGAGDGAVLKRLAELGFGMQRRGAEISASGVSDIQARGLDADLFDGTTLPYRDDEFDLVVLSHVVEHLEHPRHLIYEARRVAKHVFIEVPLEDTLRTPKDFVFNRIGHINFYSVKTIRKLAQSCGLDVLDQRVTNCRKEVYIHEGGQKGLIKYAIKQAALVASESVATRLFTYHCSLVGRRTHRFC